MKKKLLVLTLALAMTATTMTGCVKVIKIGQEGELTGKVQFDATSSAGELWESAVEDIEGKAVDLPTFFTEANGDLTSLADTYGKYSMGTSGTISYAVKGTGTVESVDQEKKAGSMTIRINDYDGPVVVKMQIGSIYKGSSTRDSLDIINFGDYTNQEEWAAMSQELHALVDSNVIQPADPANLTGKTVSFVGTFTAEGNDEILITPVSLTVE